METYKKIDDQTVEITTVTETKTIITVGQLQTQIDRLMNENSNALLWIERRNGQILELQNQIQKFEALTI